MSELDEQQSGGISRRTVTKAMAWAVPVIAIAAPAPAFAGASQGTIELTGEACKLPGNSSAPFETNGAVYIMKVTNTTNASSSITITGITRTGSSNAAVVTSVVRLSGSGTCCTLLGTTFTVNANSTDYFALVTGGWDNSANGQVTVDYTLGGVAQPPATTFPNSLNPQTPGGNCGMGGSCNISSTSMQQCIAKAVGVPECQSVGGCTVV